MAEGSVTGFVIRDPRKNNYENLEIYQLAHKLAVDLHLSIKTLKAPDCYEEGSQIRRSSKSISSNIVEAYSRRRYKAEYIKFLVYALGSCDETIEHLKLMIESRIVKESIYSKYIEEYDKLGGKINNFIKSVEEKHKVNNNDKK